MSEGFDVHKLDAGTASSPGTLQDQTRAAVLAKTGIEKLEDLRDKLDLPKVLVDYLTKSFGTKDFHINKTDVSAEDIATGTYKATCLFDNEAVILKCVPNSLLNEENKAKIATWKCKSLSDIQKCIVSFQEGHKEIFVLQDATTDLNKIIDNFKSKDTLPNEDSLWLFLKQLSEIMMKMKEKDLKYDELKLEKIFLGKDGKVCLKNPICYMKKDDDDNNGIAMSGSGTAPIYSPPEIIMGDEHTDKTTVWIIGAILYEITMLKPAYTMNSDQDFFTAVNVIVEGNKPEKLNDAFSADLQSLIWSCLDVEASERPSFEKLIQIADGKVNDKPSLDLKAWLSA